MRTPRSFIITLMALGLGLSLIFVSCMGKEPGEMSMDKLLRLGKFWLQENHGARAYNYFAEAHQKDPDRREALWGLVLSNDLRIIANLDGVVGILGGVYIYQPSLAECEEACDRLIECGLTDEARSSIETCTQDCPWGLQPMMFEDILDSDTCADVRRDALEWIIGMSDEDCRMICEDLEACGSLESDMVYNLEECIENCPGMYVERHGICYVRHVGVCERFDRTCFEHTIVGLQILFQDFSTKLSPEIMEISDILLQRPEDQYYLRHHAWSFEKPPMTLTLDGRFGVPELYFSRALANLMTAFATLATSVNLDVNTVTFDLHFKNLRDIDILFNDIVEVIRNVLYDPIFPGVFIVYDEPWAYENIEQGGIALGRMFGNFGAFLYSLMADTDRQQGKALGYSDDNRNGEWDADEMFVFRDLRILNSDLKFNRVQAEALAAWCAGVEANLVYGIPLERELFKNVAGAFDSWYLTLIADLIMKRFEQDGMVDLSPLFFDPNPTGFRDLLENLLERLEQIQASI